MPFKFEKDQIVVVEHEGKRLPVFVHPDGKEVPFDAEHALGTITRLNGESRTHREAKESAESKLKVFEGIEDAEAARKAIETLKNIDEGKLITAGKVEEIKNAAKRAAEEQVAAANKANADKLKEVTTERDKLQSDLYGEKIGGSFSRSKFISEKVAVPADMLQAQFGSAFKVEDGKIVAYSNGNKLFSRSKPGDLADFDEALEILIDAYPYKAHILKGANANGGGAGGGGGGNGGKKTMSRAQFDALDPAARVAAAKDTVITD